jgi:replicative superfamily II helicase
MQSEVFTAAYASEHCLAVAAPTGSGKTVVFELAVCAMLSSQVDASGRFQYRAGGKKVVYVAPMRVRHSRARRPRAARC